MPKKLKFNKNKQYYVDMSTEMILETIKEDTLGIDVLGHECEKKVTSLEGGIYTRNFDENKKTGGIEIVTTDKLDEYAEYLTQVTLPFDDPTFQLNEDDGIFGIRVNKVILGQGYNLCDYDALKSLDIKITKDIVRQIGKYDRVDTLELLMKENKIKKSWGNTVIEWANKVETLEWANSNLTCDTDKSNPSLADAYYTALLDCNVEKIKWLLEHDFEIGQVSTDQLKNAIKNNNMELFELLLKHNAFEECQLSDILTTCFKFNKLDLARWAILNIKSDNLSEDISSSVIMTFGDYDSDRMSLFDEKHYYIKITPETMTFIGEFEQNLDKDAVETIFLNSCEHNCLQNIEYLYQYYNSVLLENKTVLSSGLNISTKFNSKKVYIFLMEKVNELKISIDLSSIILNASIAGNVELLNTLYDTQKSEFIKVMNNKDIDFSPGISGKCKNYNDYIVINSTEHVKVLDWYKNNGLFGCSLQVLFGNAFANGHVDTMSWLSEEYSVDYTSYFNNKFYHFYRPYQTKMNFSTNKNTDNSIVFSLKWLKDRNFKFEYRFTKELFDNAQLNIFEKHSVLLEWLKENVITSDYAKQLAQEYTGNFSHFRSQLNWLLKNYPEHTELINTQLNKKTRHQKFDTTENNDIDDYGRNVPLQSTCSDKPKKSTQCIQS